MGYLKCCDRQWPAFSVQGNWSICKLVLFYLITSSPFYPQSNGFIKHTVQTVKQCIRKCAAAGNDSSLMLVGTSHFIIIPITRRIVKWKKYKALLQIRSATQNNLGQVVHKQMGDQTSTKWMNTIYSKTSKDLPPMAHSHQSVQYSQPQHNWWTPAITTNMPAASQPRSYCAEATNGAGN